MWNQNQKQNNEIFCGQMTGSYRMSSDHDENLSLVAPSDVSGRDLLGEASRKRKAVDYHDHATSGANSEIVLETRWSNKLSRQHTFGLLSSMNEQGSSMNGVSNITPCLEADEKSFQPGRYQSLGRTNYALNSQRNQMNIPNVVADTRDNIYSATHQDAFHQNGPSNLIKPPAAKIPTLPNPQSVSFTFLNQIETHNHSYSDQTATTREKSVSSINGVNFGHISSVKGNSSMNMSFKTSEGSSEAPQHNYGMFKNDLNSVERNLNGDIHNTRSFEMRRNDQALDVTQTMVTSVVGTSSIETVRLEGNATEKSFPNYVSELRVATHNNGLTSQVKPINQSDGDWGTQNMIGKEGSPSGNENHSLRGVVSPKSAGKLFHAQNGTGHGVGSQHVASKLDGESKLYSDKASSVTEKLWDGSLQLSTSAATVSAVAFFKSGEKAPEINWSKSIVVKGKVRLEAFERFIQELPRSRSRGLMVTSLCWRAGSSQSGLTCMKEVAKGYKEREKVGYAQISRGVDLYVCPRSDAIITILAKYGFFKGMAALEMDQDSLIGCVVWRRNQPSSDSVTKKIENENFTSSDEPLNSTSNPIVPHNEQPNTPFTHPEEQFSPIVSKNSYAPHSMPSFQTGDNQTEVEKSTSTANTEKIYVAPQSCTSNKAALDSAILPVSCALNNYMSSQVETPVVQSSGPEKPHSGLEFPRPIRPVSPQKITGNREAPADDNDDDLPEFDFSTACGISQHRDGKGQLARAEVPVVPPRKKVLDEGASKASRSMPSAHPTVQPMVIGSQQKSQQGSQRNLFHGVSGVSQSSRSATEIGEGEYSRSAPASLDEKPKVRDNERYGQPGIGNSTSHVTSSAPKSMWDDDDDMPEWCPPTIEPQIKHKMLSTTRPSVPCIPSSPLRNSYPSVPPSPFRKNPSIPPSPFRNSYPDNKLSGPPQSPFRNSYQDNKLSSPPSSPFRNSYSDKKLPGPPQSPFRHSYSDKKLPGPPPSPFRHSYSDKKLPGPPPSPFRHSDKKLPGPPPSPFRHSYPDNKLPGPPPSPFRHSYTDNKVSGPPPSPFRHSYSDNKLSGPPPSPFPHSDKKLSGPPPSPFRHSDNKLSGPPPSPFRHSDYKLSGPPPSPFRHSYPDNKLSGPPPSPFRHSYPDNKLPGPPPSPFRNSYPDNKLSSPPSRMKSTTRPSPSHNSNSDTKLPSEPPTRATSWPPSPYTSSTFRRWESEDMSPDPPPPTANTRPPSSYASSSVPSWKSENKAPDSPPATATSDPPSSYMPPPTPTRNSRNISIPVPIPPPATSKPSFSYMPSPAPNRKSESTFSAPPPFASLTPPPPPPRPLSDRSQFHTQDLSHGYQSSTATGSRPSQTRAVGIQPPASPSPSLGFTYNPTSRPQTNTFDVRPPVWRDRRR